MIMKKILLGLVMLLTAATMSAQIELEYVFDGYGLVNNTDIDPFHVKSVYMVQNGNSVDIFNADFSHRTTWNNVDAWSGMIIAENIFTNDGTICYITPNSDWSGYLLINETGSIINTIPHSGMPALKKVGGQYKLFVMDEEGGKTYVYSCPGNGEVTTSVENVPAKVKRNAYPNPASDLVILPYDANGATSMKIYDMQGKLVERKFLDKNKQELQLNVKDYPSGMYFFEVNGESNSFIVE